ncbi:Fimbrin-1 [Monoraphidium neglectum]|uniref:Fimbrin-1 n=1 Tax=Monoraphidium neglectum TaxID=145388 RepID=A0A0D2KZ82_9CHLO|nr:Fimbrin-1 [Monoraphidium neglectum]KIZ00514.1 Fimbrin-1 [Monoraphidium neglectum]|eukprot:XP_013899533.1 Fimbrin-1 [Monoraphidium neglectum]
MQRRQQRQQQQQQQQQQQAMAFAGGGSPGALEGGGSSGSGAWSNICFDQDEVEAEEDPGISQEELAFRMWLNSLGLPTKCTSLFGPEVRSGWLLLEVLDHLQPGCVNWALANRPPFRRDAGGLPRGLENCGLLLETAQEALGLRLVSMGPHDIIAGRRKPILSLVYQLMRFHVLQVLESLGGDDDDRNADEAPQPLSTPRSAAPLSAGGGPPALPLLPTPRGAGAPKDPPAPGTPGPPDKSGGAERAPRSSDGGEGSGSGDGADAPGAERMSSHLHHMISASAADAAAAVKAAAAVVSASAASGHPSPPRAGRTSSFCGGGASAGGGAPGGGSCGGSGAGTPRGARSSAGGGVGGSLVFGSSSIKQRRRPLRVTEGDIIAWANGKMLGLQGPWVPAAAEDKQALQQQQQQQEEEDGQLRVQELVLGDDPLAGRRPAAAVPPLPLPPRAGAEADASGPGGMGAPRLFGSFRDPSLATGVAVLQVLGAVSPGCVDPAFIAPGADAAEREANARYALAVARRIGVSTFLLWNDVTSVDEWVGLQVQPRLMLVLFAALMAFDQQKRRQQQQQQHVQAEVSARQRQQGQA